MVTRKRSITVHFYTKVIFVNKVHRKFTVNNSETDSRSLAYISTKVLLKKYNVKKDQL